MRQIDLIGYASGVAANNIDCALGPLYLQQHPQLFWDVGFEPVWHGMVNGMPKQAVGDILQQFHQQVLQALVHTTPLAILGGDHSMGIATWHAVMHHYRKQGPVGLIWVDAHMDAHTPDSSHSKNIHGMPIAHLLGLWSNPINNFSDTLMFFKPQHLCIIGVRSYESEEYEQLKRLGVKIYFMDEVRARGIGVVFEEARNFLRQQTVIQGLSVDLDAFDPEEISGVGCPEVGGISTQAFLKCIREPDWSVVEIAEYNPIVDQGMKTANFIPQLLKKVIR